MYTIRVSISLDPDFCQPNYLQGLSADDESLWVTVGGGGGTLSAPAFREMALSDFACWWNERQI